MIRLKLIFFIFICILPNVFSQNLKRPVKITPTDRRAGDNFGWATAICKNYCVVSTPHKRLNDLQNSYESAGSAYIFKKQLNGSWKQVQQLEADTLEKFVFFGASVCMNDSFIVLGADGEDAGMKSKDPQNRMGAVYIYKLYYDGKWERSQKIILNDRKPEDKFGYKVCITKNYLAVSAMGKTNTHLPNTGALYVYSLSENKEWVLKEKIMPPGTNCLLFGHAISISDSALAVSSDSPDEVYVYRLAGNEKSKLIASLNATNVKDEQFGSSLSVYRDQLVIGAIGGFDNNDGPEDSDTNVIKNGEKYLPGSGACYIYNLGKGKCTLKQRITAKDNKAEMHFGNCIGMSDSLLVIGAFGDKLPQLKAVDNRYAGAAYVFKKDKNKKWTEVRKITPLQRSPWDKFAFSVSVFEKSIIVGSRFENENFEEKLPLEDAGAAYIYEE